MQEGPVRLDGLTAFTGMPNPAYFLPFGNKAPWAPASRLMLHTICIKSGGTCNPAATGPEGRKRVAGGERSEPPDWIANRPSPGRATEWRSVAPRGSSAFVTMCRRDGDAPRTPFGKKYAAFDGKLS